MRRRSARKRGRYCARRSVSKRDALPDLLHIAADCADESNRADLAALLRLLAGREGPREHESARRAVDVAFREAYARDAERERARRRAAEAEWSGYAPGLNALARRARVPRGTWNRPRRYGPDFVPGLEAPGQAWRSAHSDAEDALAYVLNNGLRVRREGGTLLVSNPTGRDQSFSYMESGNGGFYIEDGTVARRLYGDDEDAPRDGRGDA